MRMKQVAYPNLRREVMVALAALADQEYQENYWFPQGLVEEGDEGVHFDMVVHILFDDCCVLPEPTEEIGVIGKILIDGPEIPRLRRLGDLLNSLLDDYGDVAATYYVRDERWPPVVEAASLALVSMVLAGAYCDVS